MVDPSDYPGVSVFRTTNNGKEVWKATKSLGFVNGKRRFINGFGSTPELAYARLQLNIEKRLRNPQSLHKPRRKKILFSTFFDRWLKAKAGVVVPSTLLKYERDITNHVLPYIGSMGLEQITPHTIDDLFNKTLIGIGTSAQEHTFKELSRLFNDAVKQKLIESNPCNDIANKPKHKPEVRKNQNKYIDRYVNMSKYLRKWLQDPECPFHDDYPRYMMMLLGLRRAEILGLTWDCITGLDRKGRAKLTIKQELMRHERNEEVTGWYLADRTKNKEQRTIILPEDWRKALLMQKKKGRKGIKGTDWENLIFVNQKGRNYTYNDQWLWWKNLLTAYWRKDPKHKGDLPKTYYWRPHDNRHILASVMAANDIPITTAQSILGHLDSATTAYYTHVTQKSQKEAMEKIADLL